MSRHKKQTDSNITKLPPIPQGAKIQKRALNRHQPAGSSDSRIIYVSSGTPFMSAVKRVRKQLNAGLRSASAAPKSAGLHSRIKLIERAAAAGSPSCTVTVMGTGKAIEKTLSLASWFEQVGDCEVEMKTKTVATIDDVIVEELGEEESRVRRLSCLEVSIRLK